MADSRCYSNLNIPARFANSGERTLPACWFRHSAETNFYLDFVSHQRKRIHKVRESLEAFASTLQACAPQTTAATSGDVSSLRGMKQKKRDRSFPFLQVNQREPKPRTHGLTEIRGPYYSVVGRRYLEDLLELMAVYVEVCRRLFFPHAGNRSSKSD